LRIGADLEEVPKSIAWKEEEALEEHVPNAPEKDQKAKPDAAAKRKRTIAEMTGDVNEEEMEEYRRKRTMAADPMAAYLNGSKADAV
jgi:pre-mRNA-processing factor SLU7